jgi:hypothetical protein
MVGGASGSDLAAGCLSVQVGHPLLWAATETKSVSIIFIAGLWLLLFSGFALLIAVVAGARYVRWLNRRPLPPSRMVSDRWYEKPLVDSAAHAPEDDPDARLAGEGDNGEPDGDDCDDDSRDDDSRDDDSAGGAE